MSISILELLDLGEKNQFDMYNVPQPHALLLISSFLHFYPVIKHKI